jgi:hypothetical protein
MQQSRGPVYTYLVAELIWQQWAAEYGTDHFSMSWTCTATLAFMKLVNKRSRAGFTLNFRLLRGPKEKELPLKKSLLRP